MRLVRPKPPRAMISLVSMIDVLMILLIFFMVTSTYLDLKMVPMAESAEAPGTSAPGSAETLLIRLGPDGKPRVRGQVLEPPALTALLQSRLASNPATSVIVLPSGQADAQALVALMDAATRAGAVRMQILRLEPGP